MSETTPQHPNAIPLEWLPDGWKLYRIGWCGTTSRYTAIGYSCNLVRTHHTSDDNVHAKGYPTLRDAFMAAVDLAERKL